MNSIEKQVLGIVIDEAISQIQANEAGAEAFLGKEAGYGEAAIISGLSKVGGSVVGPAIAALAQAAFTAFNPQLPTYEGDAVAWAIAGLQSLKKSLGV